MPTNNVGMSGKFINITNINEKKKLTFIFLFDIIFIGLFFKSLT